MCEYFGEYSVLNLHMLYTVYVHIERDVILGL